MANHNQVAFANAWDRLTPEQRAEVADPPTEGVSIETFRRLMVMDGPPIVALVGWANSADPDSRYVDGRFSEYVRERIAADE